MTINLITKEQYERLLEIQKEHPILTLQNVGYETPDTSKFNEADHLAAAEVSEILKGCILGFSEFKNFKISKSGEVRVRFDYDYCADENPKGALGSFVGVGYLFLRTMLNGF